MIWLLHILQNDHLDNSNNHLSPYSYYNIMGYIPYDVYYILMIFII